METALTAPKERQILLPQGFAATVWKHFGFYESAKKTTDKTYAICRFQCFSPIEGALVQVELSLVKVK